MEREAAARPESAHALFEYLAASRPGRPERGRAPAIAAAIGIHAVVLTLAVWATMAAHPSLARIYQTQTEYTVDLLPPSVLAHARDASNGRAAVADRAQTAAQAAREHAFARTDGRALASARSAVQAMERALAAPPPDMPTDVAPPTPAVLATLERSEYGGITSDSTYTAAQIVANHHEPSADDLAAAPPRLVAYTEAPELANADFVRKKLSREYPEYLQDEGIGGRVVLWFLVDEQGNVRKWLMKQSSGHKALDRAALKVAALMRFRPATNYDRHVAVWVALPVYFQTVVADGSTY